MLRLEIFEIKERAARWWKHFYLPLFMPRVWKALFAFALLFGIGIGVFLAMCTLAWRGLI